MKTLEDLLARQLKDLYSAESQLLEVLPKMVKNTKDGRLKKSFENHLETTKIHQKRLKDICIMLNISPNGKTCKAVKGLIKEAKGFLKEVSDNELKDVGLIAEIQRFDHYKISGYGTAVRYGKELGHEAIAKKLQETLNEEYNCDEKLTIIAENRLNRKVMEKL